MMAGQNHAERKTGGQSSMILSGNDSVASDCGFAVLCSLKAPISSLVPPPGVLGTQRQWESQSHVLYVTNRPEGKGQGAAR